ncbi:TspO/MBR family protein [Allorhodopirellula heiligendammensis]|uniref:TspO/MBR family protein n=1 Tax=Allorhodopirellula heiligendammensis TaxID=2714739 RepID=A0A5C6BZ54_9BACT|nr:TspO/MBR family protein [Allorhodopirellula heiligendammensis]TWU16194.1 TspO/MBR family protein [Allorhodopirellula heiligendammensis]
MNLQTDWRAWYDALGKPAWTPEPSTISLIWTILYPIIVVTFLYVFYKIARKQLPWRVGIPFAINLVANLAFTPILFGLQNLQLAAVDITIVWLSLLWAMVSIWPHQRWIAIAQVPYFVWVSIASMLQFAITANN